MAVNLTKIPFLRLALVRGYAHTVPVSGSPAYELKSTVLPNKLVVAAADNDSSIVRISIVFKAGSRNESSDNLGVTHVLRTAAGLSTKNATQFAITRNIQQVGANLKVSSDRETIAYTLEGTRAAIERSLPFLAEVATQQIFKPWEVSDLSNRLLLDIATRSLQLRAVDLLHNAAFRVGLGNSLFIPKQQIGKISPETLQHYVASNFLSGRTAVVGTGLALSELSQYAQNLKIEAGEGCNTPSSYKGGELRSNKGGNHVFVGIAGEGAAVSNPKEALAFAILQHAVGVGPQIKWSTKDNGLLTKTVGNTGVDYASTAFNVSYSDTGLFGILIAAPAQQAKSIVESAFKLFKNGNISDGDVKRGKNQLKAQLLLEGESGGDVIQSLGKQTLLVRCVQTPCEAANAVDSISTNDVQNALKKASKKVTLASIGNLSDVPYLDELK